MNSNDQLEKTIIEMAEKARIGARSLATLSSTKKNSVLLRMAEGLRSQTSFIQQENEKDGP